MAWGSPICARCSEQAVEAPLDAGADAGARRRSLDRLARDGRGRDARARRRRRRASRVLRTLHVRYDGTDAALVVPLRRRATRSRRASPRRIAQRFGFVMPEQAAGRRGGRGRGVGADATADGRAARGAPDRAAPTPLDAVDDLHRRRARIDAPVYRPRRAAAGRQRSPGPALIREANATTVVEPGWRARLDARRYLMLERVEPLPRARRDRHRAPIR